MNPSTPYPPPTTPAPSQDDIHNPIESMLPGERNICEIIRHPIGMLGIYVMAGLVLVVAAVLAFVVAPDFLTSFNKTNVLSIGGLVFLIIAIFTAGFLFVSNKVYWGNRWVLTTDSLTQITQTSLFDKQSSQLSLGNLEDVTAEQNGVLTHMFNYGVLRVETAGERSKFLFLFCPNPNYYAQQVLRAREAFEQDIRQVGGVNQGTYNQNSAPAQSFPQPNVPPAQPPTNPYPDTATNPTEPDDGGRYTGV